MSAKEEKTGLYALKPGDRVQVFDVNGPRRGMPKGGWDGTVVKVGRTLIHVDYPGGRWGKPTPFRLEDGSRANDDYGHQHIRTVEQAAEEAHRSELAARLRAGGVDLSYRRAFTIETLEALVAALDATGALPESTED
jgi:hypothetical protein